VHQQVLRSVQQLIEELQEIVDEIRDEWKQEPLLPFTWALNELDPVCRTADWLREIGCLSSPRFRICV